MKSESSFAYKRRLLSKSWWLFLPLLFSLLAMLSCSSGGIGGTGAIQTQTSANGGSPGITSVGPITALGSIYVNGIEFQTTNAAVTINGSNSDEKELQVGMVVKVEGTVNADGKTGKANMVVFDPNAAGPITGIDLGKSSLTVMGQTVFVDAQTIIAGLPGNTPGLANLATNDMVEISGLADADGNIIATRISLKTAGLKSKVSGRVSSLTSTTFKINALAVDYSKALLRKFGPAGIQPGDIVDVTGNFTSATTLLADVIEIKSSDLKDKNNIEVEGFIDNLYYAGQAISGFAIITQYGLQRVAVDASTIFSGGSLIKAGARVQVEGIIQNNTIQATKLEFLESVKMKGSAATVVNPSFDGN